MKIFQLQKLFLIFVVALAIGMTGTSRTAQAQTQVWQHPGVLVSQAQLDFIKARYAAGDTVIVSQVSKAEKSEYGSTSYTPKGPYSTGVEVCGSDSSPDDGCSDGDSDTDAAYIQSLLWYITGNQLYATNVIKIMNAYASGLKGFEGFTTGYPCTATSCSNGPLQAGWDSAKWTRAAEIIRYGNGGSAGWAAADITAFSNMLTNIYEPLIYNGSDSNGNWELVMIEGMMGIAVFNEDASLLAHAQQFWAQRVPAYFYYEPLDGDTQPAFPPGRQGDTTWNGQLIFNAGTSGVTQETCRDLKHTEMGIASAIDAAETDYIQGGTLYTANGAEQRLIQSLNLAAGLETAASKTAPTNFCTGDSDKLTLGVGTTYVIGYNEYHNRLNDPNMASASGTTGLNGTANTYTWIQNGLLPQSLNSDQGVHMAIFEALTHYENAPAAGSFQLSFAPASQNVAAGSSTAYTLTVSPSGGFTGSIALSVSGGLPAGATATLNPTSVSGGSGTSTLTVTTTSSTPAGSYTVQVAGTSGSTTNNSSAGLTVITSSTAVTVTANNLSLPYGSTIPTPGYTLSPAVTLTTNPSCTTTANSSSVPGTYPITCSGAVQAGDTFTYVNGTLTITPIAVTVTATAESMVQGGTVPTLAYTLNPSVTSFTTPPGCTTTVNSSSPAGTYTGAITCSGAVKVGYAFSYVAGTMTVTSPGGTLVVITANSQTIQSGSAIPTLTYIVTPATTLTTNPTCTTTATASSPTGSYPITCTGAAKSGDTFYYAPGSTLTISSKAVDGTITITADNQTMSVGGPLPTFTYTVNPSGSSLATKPTCTTTATTSSPAETYPITCEGAAKSKENITYVPGFLTVSQ